MPSKAGQRSRFTFGGGLFTEQSPVNVVPGTWVEGMDYVPNRDGSVRRRRPIRAELGHPTDDTGYIWTSAGTGSYVSYDGPMITIGDTPVAPPRTQDTVAHNWFLWKGVGGDPSVNWMVIQVGLLLVVFEDAETLSETPISFIDLTSQIVDPDNHTADAANSVVTFSSGRGDMFCANRYIRPTVIYIDEQTQSPVVADVGIYVRDFDGITDGTSGESSALFYTTTATELSEALTYNLLNRGWQVEDWQAYYAYASAYPSLNMVPWMGYKRVNAENEWSSAKMAKEFFGASSAPQGRFFNNPFDTTEVFSMSQKVVGSSVVEQATNAPIQHLVFTGDNVSPVYPEAFEPVDTDYTYPDIFDAAASDDNGPWKLQDTDTVELHFASPGHGYGDTGTASIIIAGNVVHWNNFLFPYTKTLDGVWTATISSSTVLLLDLNDPDAGNLTAGWNGSGKIWRGFMDGCATGSLIGAPAIPDGSSTDPSDIPISVTKQGGWLTDERPTAVGYWAGRAWWAGTPYPGLADTVFFSQLAEARADYGKAYQENDPTGRDFNQVLDTDGGTMKVPGLGGVVRMEPIGNYLVIMATNGIWAISGGQGGFTALNYNVTQLADYECTSAAGVARTESGLIITTKRGIVVVSIDTNSGYPSAQNISAQNINTKWHTYTDAEKARANAAYDDANHRLRIHIGNEFLVFDASLNCWYTETCPDDIAGVLAIGVGDNANLSNKIKYVWLALGQYTDNDVEDPQLTDSWVMIICDQNQPFRPWEDVDDVERLPYITMAPEHTGDEEEPNWAPRKMNYAFVHTFARNTFDADGITEGEVTYYNDGGTLVQGRWDWTLNGNAGKFSTPQQIYRKRRGYGHAVETDSGYYDTITSRLKIRGMGQALQVRFDGEEGKDSWIMGYTVDYGSGRPNNGR